MPTNEDGKRILWNCLIKQWVLTWRQHRCSLFFIASFFFFFLNIIWKLQIFNLFGMLFFYFQLNVSVSFSSSVFLIVFSFMINHTGLMQNYKISFLMVSAWHRGRSLSFKEVKKKKLYWVRCRRKNWISMRIRKF